MFESELVKIVLANQAVARNLLTSLLVIIIVYILRGGLTKAINRMRVRPEVSRRWIVLVKNISIAFGVFALFSVWAAEIKTFAVSIVAIAAALVIATKELILCFLGGLLKVGTRPFSIGDRIEIGTCRGDVTDHNLLTTTIYEIGPGREFHQLTGRVLIMPNSLLLTTPLINETKTGTYVLHAFKISISSSEDVKVHYDKLLQSARKVCLKYQKAAHAQFQEISRKQGLEPAIVEPRVSISYPKEKTISFLVRIAVPHKYKGRVEQKIIGLYSGIETPDHL